MPPVDFIQPDFGTPAPSSAPEATPTPSGFSQPDLMTGSVMRNWDPEQGRVVPPAEGFRTTLSPVGLDTGIELPEWASQAAARVGQDLYSRYLGTKQYALGAAEQLPGAMGDWAKQKQLETKAAIREGRRAREELEEVPAGYWGGLAGDLGVAATVGRLFPQTGLGAAGFGGLYAATEPTLPGESTTMNVLGGAGLGLGGKWATDLGGKLVHGAGGLTPQWLRPYTGSFGQLPPEVEARMALAKQIGVPIRAGDVTEAPGIVRMESFAEAVPGSGMGDFLKRQIGETKRYFQGLKNRLGTKFDYREQNAVIEGVLNNYEAQRATGEKLYDKLGKIAAATKTKTNVTTQELGPRLAALQRLDNNFWNRGVVTDDVKPLLMAVADGTKTRLTFDEWNKVKRALGGMGSQLEKQERQGSVPGELVGAAKQAYGAAMDDIDRWGRSVRNTRVKTAYDAATTHHRENVVPFEDKRNDLLKRIVYGDFDDKEYASLGASLFTEPGAAKLEQLVKYTDSKGRRALDNWAKRRVVEGTTGISEPTGVQPIAAAKAFESSSTFSPQAKAMLPRAEAEGRRYAQAGRMLERAGDLPSGTGPLEHLPAWAMRASPLLFPAAGVALGGTTGGWEGGLAGGTLGTLAALAAGKGATALSTTRPGIRMMASPSNVFPGAPSNYFGAPLGLESLEDLLGNR